MTKKKVRLFDGAFGTYYQQLTGSLDCCELANINSPDIVFDIHRRYLSAGAVALKTNTFQASPARYGDPRTLEKIISAGYEIACRASAPFAAQVFADIGNISEQGRDIAADYLNVAKIFAGLGATRFLFETLDSAEPLAEAIAYIRESVKGAEIIASFAVSPDGYTSLGMDYRDLITKAKEMGADIAGLNCICGPSHMVSLMSRIEDRDGLIAMPNAGYPVKIDGRTVYRDNPDYFAQKIAELAGLGISNLGGCCGTTPEHIRMASERLKAPATKESASVTVKKAEASMPQSRFAASLEAGKFVIAAEVDPPFDTDVSFLLSSAERLKELGADALTLADSPLARPRADSLVMAAKVLRQTGLDVIPHLSCRDRNRIAIQSALLAANVEDVSNVLIVTGDSLDGLSHDKTVYNFNSVKLMSYIKSLNGELFASKPFSVFGALNVNALNFGAELSRAKLKAEAGATALFTQAIFTPESVENLKCARRELPCKILAGILPVASYKNAVFLNNEVSGMSIPAGFISSLEGKTPQEVTRLSLGFSLDIISRVSDFCDGIYIMTPLKRIDLVCKLIESIKEKRHA